MKRGICLEGNGWIGNLNVIQFKKSRHISTQLKNKKVLVTGGAGFIGSNLCQALLNLEVKVTCLDNFATGHRKNIDALLEKYRSSELPKTRKEFESRAILYQILIELESLLEVNLAFYKVHPNFLK